MTSDQTSDQTDPVRTDARSTIRRLALTRLALTPLGFGMTVAAGINLLQALPRMLRGDFGSLISILPILFMAAFIVAFCRVMAPRMDRQILELSRGSAGESTSPELLRMALGFPLFGLQSAIEAELARQLSTVDEAWWEEHAKELREQVNAAIELARHPSVLRKADGPWIPALLDAIGRCGRTEYIRQLESIVRKSGKREIPGPVVEAAQTAVESLRERQRRDKEVATLLRPSLGRNEALLRPAASATAAESERLLRPEFAPEAADVQANKQEPVERMGEIAESVHIRPG